MPLIPHNPIYQINKPYHQEYYQRNKEKILENQRIRLKLGRPKNWNVCAVCEKEVPKERRMFKIKTCSRECSNQNTKTNQKKAMSRYHFSKTAKSIWNKKCITCLTSIKYIKGRVSYCSNECTKVYKRIYDYIYHQQRANPTWLSQRKGGEALVKTENFYSNDEISV